MSRYEEAVALRRRLGDALLVTDAVYNLGLAAFRARDHARARREFGAALEQARELGEAPYIAASQLLLAEIALDSGEAEDAAARARESLALYSELEDERSRARCLVVLAGAAVGAGSHETAARLLGAADTARGDDAPDEFELPILERILPELESRIGQASLHDLQAEGLTGTEIVSIDSRA